MNYDSHVILFRKYFVFESHVFEFRHNEFRNFKRLLMSID